LDGFARFVRTVSDAASPGGTGVPPVSDPQRFSDEMGHRRPVDAPFLAWRTRTASVPRQDPPPDAPLDVLAWSAVTNRDIDIDVALARHAPPAGGFGALVDQGALKTIEVWTETELSALHALFWIALRKSDARLGARVLDAARWHIAHMQPDNATNHPWSAHVFALVDVIDDAREAGLYAQTLVHNCQTQLGRPDRFSALILLDCADGIDALTGRQ